MCYPNKGLLFKSPRSKLPGKIYKALYLPIFHDKFRGHYYGLFKSYYINYVNGWTIFCKHIKYQMLT